MVGCSESDDVQNIEDENISAINSNYINLTMVRPTTINPIINNDKSVGYVLNLIYDSLFTVDENYDVVKQLVDEYSVDENFIYIKLKDVFWHDDTKLTAKDVEFTIDLIKKNEESPYFSLVENIDSLSIINDLEFNIKFKEKYAFSLDTLIFPIVSMNKLGTVSNNLITEYKYNLVGTGPYKIEQYKERDMMVLTVNESYYEKVIDTTKDIKVIMVPDNESQIAMVSALQSDIASVSLNDLSKFQEDEFKIVTYEGREFEMVLFNFDNPFFKDVNFRKAISHAINRDYILEEAYINNATIANFPLNTNSKYYDKELVPLSFDKDLAKEYLEKVELTVEDIEENKEEIKNNEEIKNKEIKNEEIKNENIEENEEIEENIIDMISQLDLKIAVNKDNGERKKAAYAISSNLKSIGLKSTVIELTSDELDIALNNKDYDLAIVGWELSTIPDASYIIENCGYIDESLSAYLLSLQNATTQTQVKDIYKAIQSYINENAIFLNLVIRNEYVVFNKRIDGKSSPNDVDVYEGITNLKIK
jgi:ABC-type transport system substrate-binding protein